MDWRRTFQPTGLAGQLREASDALDEELVARGATERARFAARLVAEELVLNAVEHGGARSVIMEADPDAAPVRLVFDDDGASFDPSIDSPVPPGDAPRGRGLVLVHAFTRSIAHERREERNRVTVELVD